MNEQNLTFNADELLEIWDTLPLDEKLDAFQRISRNELDYFVTSLSSRDQAELFSELPMTERRFWLRLLSPDDAADVIQEADADVHAEWLDLLDKPSRAEVTALLAYKEDVAGGVMTPRYGRLRPEMTVDAAISYLRQQSSELETINYAYVLDHDQHLLGVVSLRNLLTAQRGTLARDIMETDIVYATEDMDQEHVARLISDNRLLAIPVVDASMHMKGIITVDDMVDVVQQEASEDMQKIAGMEALDGPYLQTSFFDMVQKRAGWLAILFLGEMLTATAMAYYEDEIAKAVVLALFLPLIISSGGNSGSQATTLVIRAMAVGEVTLEDWWRVVRRELFAGLTLGGVLAVIGLIRILAWQFIAHSYGAHYISIALTVSLSLVGVVTFGTLAGSMLPFILRRLGFDPASASAPFVATLVDVTGLVIYFSIAELMLRGSLL